MNTRERNRRIIWMSLAIVALALFVFAYFPGSEKTPEGTKGEVSGKGDTDAEAPSGKSEFQTPSKGSKVRAEGSRVEEGRSRP